MILWLTQMAFAQELTEIEPIEVSVALPVSIPVEEVKTEVWFECKPMSGMLNLWSVLPESMRNNAGGFSDVSLDTFTRAGGNPEGTFRAYGSEHVIMEMDYLGSEEQLIGFLEMIQPESVIWQQSPDTWLMELPSDRWLVKRDNNMLRLHSAQVSAIDFTKPAERAYLSSQDGCAVVVKNGPEIKKLQRPMEGGLFLPFEQGPVEVVLKLEQALPPILQNGGVTPMEVLLPEKPFGVMTLGFSSMDLFDDPKFTSRFEFSEKDVRKLQKRLRILPGSLALVHDINIKKDPKISVAFGLENRFGNEQWTCLIWRGLRNGLKDMKKDFIVLERNVLSIEVDGQPIYFGVVKGRLYASTFRDGIDQLMIGEGTPAVDPEFGAYASTLPLAIQVNIPAMMSMMVGGLSTVELGVKGKDEFVMLSLNANISAHQILSLLLSQTQKAGMNQEIEEQAGAYQRKMMVLAAKEQQHFAQSGIYLPVGQTGRELQVIESIEIPQAESAFALGWLSDDDGNIYWVESDGSSFEVHALVTMEIGEAKIYHVVKHFDGSLEILE